MSFTNQDEEYATEWEELHDLKKKKLDYTWDDLQKIEERRREILSRVSKPFWTMLSYWEGTCLRVLARDSLLWVSLILYTAIRVQCWYGGLPLFVKGMGHTNIDIVGGFLSFFLVLFVNQSNTRFHEMYKKSMECEGRLYDIAYMAIAGLPRPNALRIVRYMNAAHVAAYVGLSDTYTKTNLFESLNVSYQYLTDDERKRIDAMDMDSGSECFRELCMWTMMEVQTAAKQEMMDGRYAGEMRSMILRFRSAFESIYDYSDQPIHFYYIHFLSLLTAIYLPVFAISSAYAAGTSDMHWTTDILNGLIVVLQAVFVVGLRLLGQRLLDPYGDDLEDLSVIHYVQDGWKTSHRILATEFPSPLDEEFELGLARTTAPLGFPWDKEPHLRKRGGQQSKGVSSGNTSSSNFSSSIDTSAATPLV